MIYVGTLIGRKHPVQLARAVLELCGEFPDVELHFVGDGGECEQEIRVYAERYTNIHYHGRTADKERLRQLYARCDVFAMPSVGETFGLVYIEALTQGLPVLYTKNDGVDGIVPPSAGVGVRPDVRGIKEGLRKMLGSPGQYATPVGEWFGQFRWSKIAAHYAGIYDEVRKHSI